MQDYYDKLGEHDVRVQKSMQYEIMSKQHLQNIPSQKKQYYKTEYSNQIKAK